MSKKYPFVKQTGIKDCGVACLQMIIKYYQGYLNTRKLQELTKTNKNGTTAFHIIEAAKQIGFEAKGVKAQISDINKNNMLLPCIANVTIDNKYNHYIVIYNIDYKRKIITIADPADKIKRISFDNFEKIWNNILLFMYPIKKIPLYTKEPNLFKIFVNTLIINKKLTSNIVIISLFYSFFTIIGSYYFKFIGDSLIQSQQKNYVTFIFFIFLLFTILKILSNFFRNQLLIYLNEKLDLLFTNNIFKDIIFLPYNYYRNHTTGEIVSRMNDLGQIREMISKTIITIFIDLPLSLISLILLYMINEKLCFISIIILIIHIIIIIIITPIIESHIDNVQTNKADYTSYMVETINGFESVKGIGIEELVIEKFETKFINYLKKIFNFESLYNKQVIIKQILSDVGFICIIFIGCLLILENKLTIGNLLMFNSLFNYLLLPFGNALEYSVLFKEAHNSLKRVLEITNQDIDNGKITKKINGLIKFKNLNYSYNDRDLILKNINLTIQPKEKVMIIGNSGSGKSTLVKLLLQYYQTNRGNVMLDNIDINDYKKECLKKSIIYISQNETIFNDTLYNNINLENKLNDEEFIEITKNCYIDEIVKNSNTGYNMLIEENGFNLSGGEKQRIVLARSLTRNFDILIIDEGLNQIDINLERKILKNILTKYKDKTIIIISHRLENMDLFDHIIEFSNHKIKKDIKKNV